jgi:hypothetical protein
VAARFKQGGRDDDAEDFSFGGKGGERAIKGGFTWTSEHIYNNNIRVEERGPTERLNTSLIAAGIAPRSVLLAKPSTGKIRQSAVEEDGDGEHGRRVVKVLS